MRPLPLVDLVYGVDAHNHQKECKMMADAVGTAEPRKSATKQSTLLAAPIPERRLFVEVIKVNHSKSARPGKTLHDHEWSMQQSHSRLRLSSYILA
jgi:hypothetical protein